MGSDPELVIGVGVFGLSLAVVGFWWYRQIRRDSEAEKRKQVAISQETTESIMDAILALDDLFQAGELADEAYHQRRLELKNRLKELMESKGSERNL